MRSFLESLDEVRPALVGAGEQVAIGVERIVARLDLIAERVRSEEFEEHRRFENFTLTADVPVEMLSVAVGDSWELETVSVLGAATLTITESGRFRWAKQFNAADAVEGSGLIFRQGAEVWIVSNGNGSPVGVSIQLKQRARKNPKKVLTGGFSSPMVSEHQRQLPIDRHFGGH